MALVTIVLFVLGCGSGSTRVAVVGRDDRRSTPPMVLPYGDDGPHGLHSDDPRPGCRHPWEAPVEAVVIDPFRPPSTRYGAGNRGLEYDTEAGQPVAAVAAGSVRFAGPVGGTPVVVIDHGGGLVSTYVHLLERSVDRGQVVTGGERVAVAATGFHLTARLGGRYVDPAGLLEARCEVVRLVADPTRGSR